MDFPLDLTTHQFIKGADQYKQDIELLFNNVLHSFLQDWNLGTEIDIHTPMSDTFGLKLAIETTVRQIPNAELCDCKIVESGINCYTVSIKILYNGELINYTYSTDENKN